MNKIKNLVQLMLLVPVICVGMSFVSQNNVHAEIEAGSYESNSGVGFYGEYIFPSDEKLPEDEKSPEGETLPESGKGEGNTQLPQTGVEKASMSMVGLISLVAGAIVLKNKKS